MISEAVIFMKRRLQNIADSHMEGLQKSRMSFGDHCEGADSLHFFTNKLLTLEIKCITNQALRYNSSVNK